MRITAGEVVRACGGRLLQGSPESVFTSISIDSRTLTPGALFFALPGSRVDGHDFLGHAEGRGAQGAVISRPSSLANSNFTLIQVPDTLFALGQLASWYRCRFSVDCVAVTGSTGKTTTKEMITKILGNYSPTLASEENFNTEIGIPLTLFSLTSSHQALVLEFAMRGPGQIARLAEIAKPQIGVITNIGSAHLGLLGSPEAALKAKMELASSLPSDGALVILGDDPPLLGASANVKSRILTFGLDKSNDIWGSELSPQPRGMRFCLNYQGKAFPIFLPAPGAHNVLNALAAASAALTLGRTPEEVADSLSQFQLPAMRMEVLPGPKGATIINDAYNANPESMLAALKTLSEWSSAKRKIAVLGDMLELGERAPEFHREVGQRVARLGIDLLIAVGDYAPTMLAGAGETKGFRGELKEARTKGEATELLIKELERGDVVLIKGSRATRMEEIVDALRCA